MTNGKYRKRVMKNILIILLSSAFCLMFIQSALALSSTNYGDPQYQIPDIGGKASSEHYILDATGGPILGVASSSNYGLDTGFPSVTGGTITVAVNASSVDLGDLNPGTPVTGQTTVTVSTDSSAGYIVAIEKNQLLTHSNLSNTIADISGTIASPAVWSGTGFGFTVSSATNLEAKWGSGSNYALIPTQTATTYHTTLQAINAPDDTVIDYKLDTTSTQLVGDYSTIVAISATVLP